MTFEAPRNVLNYNDVGLVIVSLKKPLDSDEVAKVRSLDLPVMEVSKAETPAWADQKIWSMMETPQWRQLLIIADELGVYETGLVIMALEKGFHVFFSSPTLTVADIRAQRLKQASAILIPLDDAIAELTLGAGGESSTE